MANFIVKCLFGIQPPPPKEDLWVLFVNISFNKDGSGAGLIINAFMEDKYEHAFKFMFKASNDNAKYEALIAEIKLCYSTCMTYFDSQLMVS